MYWEKPYAVLRDLFPQVDARIIKATALEHGDDLSSSVDFIVEEILGSRNEHCAPEEGGFHTSVCQTSSVKEQKPEELLTDQASAQSTSQALWADQVLYGTSTGLGSSVFKSSVSPSTMFSSFCHDIPRLENSIAISSNEKMDESLIESKSSRGVSFLAESSTASPCDYLQAFGTDTWLSTLISNHETVGVKREDDTSCGRSMEEKDLLEESRNVGTLSEQANELSSLLSVAVYEPVEEQICSSKEAEGDCHDNPEHHESFFLGCIGDDIMTDKSIPEAGVEEAEFSMLECSSFSSMQNSQTLDNFFQQIKVEKQDLSILIDDIRNLHQKANVAEEASRQAKIEAARGALDIISKVDEMKHMLSCAREANAAHAGEVHGEKAVLATEARELLSRLVQIKAEKTKAVTILNDIRESLQERIEFANQERQAAEEELLLKETTAYKALELEEDLMAKVAQESRSFEAEAEICREFREFLIDRGSMVDSLQGEMAILCEDVEALKKRIDSCILSVGQLNPSQVGAESQFKELQASLNQSSLREGHNVMDPLAIAQEKVKEDYFSNDYDKPSSLSSDTELYLSYPFESIASPTKIFEYEQRVSPYTSVQQKSVITSESQLPSYNNLPMKMQVADLYSLWSQRRIDDEQVDVFEPETDVVRSVRENGPEEDGWSLVLTT